MYHVQYIFKTRKKEKNVMHVNAHKCPYCTNWSNIYSLYFQNNVTKLICKLVGVSSSITSLPVFLYMSVSIRQKAALHNKVKNNNVNKNKKLSLLYAKFVSLFKVLLCDYQSCRYKGNVAIIGKQWKLSN